jgi:AcrR family transcriptional regulator
MKAPQRRKPVRRTQEERRAATRSALLDATIELLIEKGYRQTATAEIAERAGVSRGARSHHFATRAELVMEAVKRLYAGLTEKYTRRFARLASGPGRIGAAYRLLWEMFLDPQHAAILELYVAARTDRQLRRNLEKAAGAHHANIIRLAREYFPELAARDPQFDSLLHTVVVVMFGLALRQTVFGQDNQEKDVLALVENLIARRMVESQDEFSGGIADSAHQHSTFKVQH